jgi:hypothetical protein
MSNNQEPGLRCWNCGNNLDDVPRPVSRHEQCQDCFEPLHCCRLCRHYRPEMAAGCGEDRADPPVVKENANFCDWFHPDIDAFSDERPDRSNAAADGLNALFQEEVEEEVQEETEPEPTDNEPIAPERSDDPIRSRLEDLFSKD